jgi:predicted ester cyclase
MIPRLAELIEEYGLQIAQWRVSNGNSLVITMRTRGAGSKGDVTVVGCTLRITVAEQANEAIIEWMVTEVFNTGNLAVIDQVGARNLCVHYPQAGGPLCGLEQVKRAFSRSRAAFPDAYFMTEDTIASGDRVVTRWTGRATHTGTFWGISPTGRLVTWTGVTIYRLVTSKIVEIWIHADALHLLQQLENNHTPGKSNE